MIVAAVGEKELRRISPVGEKTIAEAAFVVSRMRSSATARSLFDVALMIEAMRSAVCRRLFCSRSMISLENATPESRACSMRTSNHESIERPMNWLETM